MKSKYSISAILIIVSTLVLTKSNGNASPAQYEPSSFLDINPAAYNLGDNPSSSYFIGRDSVIDNSGKNKLTNYEKYDKLIKPLFFATYRSQAQSLIPK